MIIENLLKNSGMYLFLILCVWTVWKSSKALTKCQKIKESKEKRIVITNIVQAVEQLYYNESGFEKLARAKDLAVTILEGYPIEVTPEELSIYIESAVSEIKRKDSFYLHED